MKQETVFTFGYLLGSIIALTVVCTIYEKQFSFKDKVLLEKNIIQYSPQTGELEFTTDILTIFNKREENEK